jgi:hypothetical protein
MLSCRTPYEGPWSIAKGNETGLEIVNLSEGEAVELELNGKSGLHTSVYAQAGSFPLPKVKFSKYRVCKRHLHKVENPSPTIVRVLLDGVS